MSRRSAGRGTSVAREQQQAQLARAARARALRRLAGGAVAVAALVGAVVGLAVSSGGSPASGAAREGAVAPDGSFVEADGQARTVASLRGTPTLLWFVSTWCSSCQAGTRAMAHYIKEFERRGVRVVELELYEDLGQAGPSIDSFAQEFAGPAAADRDWRFGVASASLTSTYDPENYLDIYYLLNSQGRITYINSSPAATIEPLLSHVDAL